MILITLIRVKNDKSGHTFEKSIERRLLPMSCYTINKSGPKNRRLMDVTIYPLCRGDDLFHKKQDLFTVQSFECKDNTNILKEL